MMDSKSTNDTLYIFIDESGDFTFSKKGSNYFILTAVSTLQPITNREIMLQARYDLLAEGVDIESFHATEDLQSTRDIFFKKISSLNHFEIDSVIAEKRKVHYSLYEEIEMSGDFKITKKDSVEQRFYKQICETLLQYIIYRYTKLTKAVRIKKIVVVLDQVMISRKRDFVVKYIKTYSKGRFGIVPYVYFHQTKSDINSQVADYCSWAIKKKWDDSEFRPYNLIKDKIKSEFEIFKKGKELYY